jgi:hypothetical protein
MARQQLVRERTEAIDVIGGARRLAAKLLGTGRERRMPAGARLRSGTGCRQQPGNTEVGKLYPSAAVEQHVSRLQVPVHDAARMSVLEGFRDLEQHRHDLQVSRAAKAPQVPTRRELHREHHDVLDSLRSQDLKNTGMLQAAGYVVLALERLPSTRSAGGGAGEHLQSDVDAAGVVVRLPDLALSARTYPLDERVVAECDRLSGCTNL